MPHDHSACPECANETHMPFPYLWACWHDRVSIILTPGRDQCVLWDGRIDEDGYGTWEHESTLYSVHRLALEFDLARGLRHDEVAIHTCDNNACIHPNHLYSGSWVLAEEIAALKSTVVDPWRALYVALADLSDAELRLDWDCRTNPY